MKTRVCMEILELAKDEDEKPAWCGLCLEMNMEKEIPYDRLIKNVNIEELLNTLGMGKFYKAENVRFITPQEYDKKYE